MRLGDDSGLLSASELCELRDFKSELDDGPEGLLCIHFVR